MTTNVLAADLEVGDKMPNQFRPYTGSLNGINSIIHLAPYLDREKQIYSPKDFEYAFAFSLIPDCNQMTPFAVFSYKENAIYLDSDFEGKVGLVYYTGDSENGEFIMGNMTHKCPKNWKGSKFNSN